MRRGLLLRARRVHGKCDIAAPKKVSVTCDCIEVCTIAYRVITVYSNSLLPIKCDCGDGMPIFAGNKPIPVIQLEDGECATG